MRKGAQRHPGAPPVPHIPSLCACAQRRCRPRRPRTRRSAQAGRRRSLLQHRPLAGGRTHGGYRTSELWSKPHISLVFAKPACPRSERFGVVQISKIFRSVGGTQAKEQLSVCKIMPGSFASGQRPRSPLENRQPRTWAFQDRRVENVRRCSFKLPQPRGSAAHHSNVELSILGEREVLPPTWSSPAYTELAGYAAVGHRNIC